MHDTNYMETTQDWYDQMESLRGWGENEYFIIDNPIQIFRKRFQEALLLINRDRYHNHYKTEVVSEFNQYIADEFRNENLPTFERIGFLDFSSKDLIKVRELNTNFWEENSKNNLSKYIEFLDTCKFNFIRIDVINIKHAIRSSFTEMVADRDNKELMKVLQVDILFNQLFVKLDNQYRQYLINFDDSEIQQFLKNDTPEAENLEYFKNPLLLQEFEEDKLIFLKLLKAFIKELLYKRKREFKLDKLPSIYDFLEVYAEELVPLKRAVQINTNVRDEVKIPINKDFPKSIFETPADYELFLCLIGFVTNTAQVSFIYRMMAEKEKLPKIIVKDTPFREWFNSQAFHIKLDNHTKTFINAENEDRKMFYKTVKNLIINK